MRWVAAACFVVGMGVGYLLGAAGERQLSPRAQRHATLPERTRLADSGVPAEHSEGVQGEARAIPPAEPANDDVHQQTAGESAAVGTLEVDWSGCELFECELSGAGVTSSRTEFDLQPDEDEGESTLVRRTLWAGAYELDIEVRHISYRMPVLIEAGKTTRLRMRDLVARFEKPPPGFGRLTVQVFDIRGDVIRGATPTLIGADPTSSDGRTEFDMQSDGGERAIRCVRAGRYRIVMWAYESVVDVVAGRETQVAVRYSGEAEFHVQSEVEGTFMLRRLGRAMSLRDRDVHGSPRAFYFVRPGRFDLLWFGAGRAGPLKLRELTLAPGQRLDVRADLPSGRLMLSVRYPYRRGNPYWPTALRIVPVSGGDPIALRQFESSALDQVNHTMLLTTVVTGVPLGRYRIEFRQEGWKSASVEIDVGQVQASVELVLEHSAD